MARKPCWLIVPAALGLILAWGTWGHAQEPKDLPPTPPPQQPKTTGEVISDTVDSVVQGIKRGAQATSETLQEQYQRAKAAVHDMSAQARVYSRIHWDKALSNCNVEIEVKEGTVVLNGTGSLRAHAKAVELARDTVGIDQVEDHLVVDSGSAAAPAETTTTKSEKATPK